MSKSQANRNRIEHPSPELQIREEHEKFYTLRKQNIRKHSKDLADMGERQEEQIKPKTMGVIENKTQ